MSYIVKNIIACWLLLFNSEQYKADYVSQSKSMI